MSAIEDALNRVRSVSSAAQDIVLRHKAAGQGLSLFSSPMGGYGQLASFQNQSANRRRYSDFRGWVHAPIHALAMEAASQQIYVGYFKGEDKKKPKPTKTFESGNYIISTVRKTAPKGMEEDADNPLYKAIEKPNAMQNQMQLFYSFVANLCLTGWGFIIGGKKGSGYEFYSLPTTWIEPIHEQGAFAQFKIKNPVAEAVGKDLILDRSQVSFAYFPNPADPLAALAPTQAQALGIKIDDHIQTSQSVFFENGLFPTMALRIGKNPHPDVPGGMAPRLTAAQRRQIIGVVKQVWGGVANYGEPLILDGLIDGVERMMANQNEMGWDRSEMSARARILSAFGVHPFILGEGVAGSYAQSYNVEKVFFRRVNSFLTMFGQTMTDLSRSITGDEKITVWCDELKPIDPSTELQMYNAARTRGDISQDEYRAYMGLPPDEDADQAEIDKTSLTAVTAVAEKVQSGAITSEQGVSILMGLGLPKKLAEDIAGEGPPEPDPSEQQMPPGQPGQPGQPPGQPGQPNAQNVAPAAQKPQKPIPGKPVAEADAVSQAADALTKAIQWLNAGVDGVADMILDDIDKNCGTGAGGFKPGNRCSRGGGGSTTLGATEFAGKPANPKGRTTEEMYRNRDGSWTAERKALHDKIIKHFLDQATPVKNPTAYMMGGGPASGKSFALKSGLVNVRKNHVPIDSDEIKKHIPEYNKGVQKGDIRAASMSHEESSYLSKKILKVATEKSYNVMLDGTGDSGLDSLRAKVDIMRAKGAKVSATYVTVDTETAIQRNRDRAKKTGRMPPESFVRQAHSVISQIVPKALKAGLYDDFKLIDTNSKTPVLVAEGRGAELTIHNRKLWRRFLAKGDE